MRTIAESAADAPRPGQSYDRRSRAGSIRSAVRQRHSAKAWPGFQTINSENTYLQILSKAKDGRRRKKLFGFSRGIRRRFQTALRTADGSPKCRATTRPAHDRIVRLQDRHGDLEFPR